MFRELSEMRSNPCCSSQSALPNFFPLVVAFFITCGQKKIAFFFTTCGKKSGNGAATLEMDNC